MPQGQKKDRKGMLKRVRPTTILIVDDHAPTRDLMRRVCAAEGRAFIDASDGEAGVAAYTEHQPDWVLMDLRMPGMGGLEATRAIREAFPGARIVILTNHDTPGFREEAALAGAMAFVPKEELYAILDIIPES